SHECCKMGLCGSTYIDVLKDRKSVDVRCSVCVCVCVCVPLCACVCVPLCACVREAERAPGSQTKGVCERERDRAYVLKHLAVAIMIVNPCCFSYRRKYKK